MKIIDFHILILYVAPLLNSLIACRFWVDFQGFKIATDTTWKQGCFWLSNQMTSTSDKLGISVMLCVVDLLLLFLMKHYAN